MTMLPGELLTSDYVFKLIVRSGCRLGGWLGQGVGRGKGLVFDIDRFKKSCNNFETIPLKCWSVLYCKSELSKPQPNLNTRLGLTIK